MRCCEICEQPLEGTGYTHAYCCELEKGIASNLALAEKILKHIKGAPRVQNLDNSEKIHLDLFIERYSGSLSVDAAKHYFKVVDQCKLSDKDLISGLSLHLAYAAIRRIYFEEEFWSDVDSLDEILKLIRCNIPKDLNW